MHFLWNFRKNILKMAAAAASAYKKAQTDEN